MPEDSDIDSLYMSWQADPSPKNLGAVVTSLEPAINYALSASNSAGDPLVRTKARNLAAGAVRSYDPAMGAALHTWVGSQLLPLRRFRREVNQPVKIPERIQLDAWALKQAEDEFVEKHDREPDVQELSDFAKMPVRRIEKVRKSFRRMPTQDALGEGGISQSSTDFITEAVDYVYRDADGLDRQILEMKTGYGGKYEPMSPRDIAIKLQLTPSQLSRRSAGLTMQIQEVEEALQAI